MITPRLALTTTRDRSSQLIGEVAALGVEPVVLPCIELVPAPDSIIETARIESERSDWLILTSPRTVHSLWPEGAMPETKVAAVGEATADAIRTAGGRVTVIGDAGARQLADRIAQTVAGRTVFFPHAAGADPSTIHLLAKAGAVVRAQIVYEVRPVPPGDDRVDGVVFASPSAVIGWFLSRDLDGLVVGVIGETTAAAVTDHGHRCDVMPSSPSFGELTRLVAEHLRDRSTV